MRTSTLPAGSLRSRIPAWFQRHNIFYGWVIVLVCSLTLSLVFGIRLSFGIFFDALTRNGEFHWTRGHTAGVFSISMLTFALSSAPAGWLLDRLGPRALFSAGIVIMASGLVMTSRMTGLGHYYLYYGVWTGLGVTILGLSIQAATVSRWFDRRGRRGLAIGVAFSGTGVGILVLAPVVERIIAFHGWRTAYLFLALLLGTALPLTLLLMWDTPTELGLRPHGLEFPNPQSPVPSPHSPATTSYPAWTWQRAARTPTFWLIMFSGALSLFTLRMVTVHQVAHFVDRGIPRLTAAAVFGSAGLVTALAFVGFGSLSDRIGRESTFYLGTMAQVVAISLLILLPEGVPTPYLYTYAVLWGLGEGSRSSLLTAIASDAFPGPALGAIVGTLGTFFAVGAGLGSWLGGAVRDWTGTYLPAFVAALMATVVAAICIFLVHRHHASKR